MKKLIAVICFMLATSLLALAQDKGKADEKKAAPATAAPAKADEKKAAPAKAEEKKAAPAKAKKEPSEKQKAQQEKMKSWLCSCATNLPAFDASAAGCPVDCEDSTHSIYNNLGLVI